MKKKTTNFIDEIKLYLEDTEKTLKENEKVIKNTKRNWTGHQDHLDLVYRINHLKENFIPKKRPILKKHCLIIGERGSGKEDLAQNIAKEYYPKADDPLPPANIFNCACMTDKLVIGQLFGWEKNSHSMATERKSTIFTEPRMEKADRPVVFLDELHKLPLEGQGALLRAIEYNELRRLSGPIIAYKDNNKKKQKCPIIIGAVQPHALENGDLIPDLADRIFRREIKPCLSERVDLIPGLIAIFICQTLKEIGVKEREWEKFNVSKNTIIDFACMRWRGNVRELKSIVETSVIEHFETQRSFDDIYYIDIDIPYEDKKTRWYEGKEAFWYVRNKLFGKGERIPYYSMFPALHNVKAVSSFEYEAAGFDSIEKISDITYFEGKHYPGTLTLPQLLKYKIPIKNYDHLIGSETSVKECYKEYDEHQERIKHQKEIMTQAWDSARLEVWKKKAKPVLENQFNNQVIPKTSKLQIKEIRNNKEKMEKYIKDCLSNGKDKRKDIAAGLGIKLNSFASDCGKLGITLTKIKKEYKKQLK